MCTCKIGFDTAKSKPYKIWQTLAAFAELFFAVGNFCQRGVRGHSPELDSSFKAQVVRAAADLCADRDAAVRPGDDPGLPPGVGRDVPLEAEELGLFVFWRDHGPHLALGGSALGGGSGEPGSARRTQTVREITSHALPRNH